MATHNVQTRKGFGWLDALLRVTPLTVITLGLGLVFTQVCAFAALPEAKSESPNVVLGRQAIDAKDFKSAVGILTKAVQENPNDADAHTMLGYSYRKLGTFDKSIADYQD